jgi:phage-related protein
LSGPSPTRQGLRVLGACWRAIAEAKLHAFQKKAKMGIATPKAEIDLVEARLKWAEREHEKWIKAGKEAKKK